MAWFIGLWDRDIGSAIRGDHLEALSKAIDSHDLTTLRPTLRRQILPPPILPLFLPQYLP